jgi:hypothetical protein
VKRDPVRLLVALCEHNVQDLPIVGPATVKVVTAARALGIGHNKAYDLIKAGDFPVRTLTLGSTVRIPTAACGRRATRDRPGGADHTGGVPVAAAAEYAVVAARTTDVLAWTCTSLDAAAASRRPQPRRPASWHNGAENKVSGT